MLPPKKKRAKMMAPAEDDVIRCPPHMAWVRSTFQCLAFKSGECEGRMESHHVREGGGGGIGMKPPDSEVVPLCAKHHQSLHAQGNKTFEERHKLRLLDLAKEFWQRSPHRRKWEIEHKNT